MQGMVYEVIERNSLKSYAVKFYSTKDEEKLGLVAFKTFLFFV